MGNSHTNYRTIHSNNALITNAIIKIGWLNTISATRKTWIKRYVLLLKSNILLYFADSNCTEWIAAADLSKLKKVTTRNQEESNFIVITENKTYEFKAINKDNATDWINHIKQMNHIKQIPSTGTKSSFEHEMNMIRGGLMGWLNKRGELRRTWNHRWCILIPSRLLIYFSDETCQNFKGCADLRESEMTLLFDNTRTNYFCIKTNPRIWELECNTGHEVKQWSSILQFMVDLDRKVLILKSMNPHHKYPSKELLMDHFKSNGNIVDIMWMNQYKIYVIIFDENKTGIDSLMAQKRLHIISHEKYTPPSSDTSNASYESCISTSSSSSSDKNEAVKYELFALKLSEYMGNVYSSYAVNESSKAKVHGMVLSRRFSTRTVRKSSLKKSKHKNKTASLLSFKDKYNESAMSQLHGMRNDWIEQKEYSFDTSAEETDDGDDPHWSSDDALPNMRMTSVSDRGQQIYSDPNELKTYIHSCIFNFCPSQKGITLTQSATDISYVNDDVIECGIIIDNGGGYIKAGLGVSAVPIVMPNQCIQCNDEYMLFDDDTMNDIDVNDIIYPVERDKISDWDAMNFIWEYMVCDVVKADEMNEYPIMITEPPGIESILREKELSYFMETHNLHSFYMMNSALANFYYTGKRVDEYCVIVDVGHCSTNISCIYNGMYYNGMRIDCAGQDITNYLSCLMSNDCIDLDLDTAYTIAHTLKEEYCFVATESANNDLIHKKYTLPDGRILEIKNQQYQAPEILFNSNASSLQSVLVNCVNQFDDDDVEQRMYANIYCCGGSVKLRNFECRLQSELTSYLSRKVSIVSPQDIAKGVCVKIMNEPQLSAWNGCSMICEMSTFKDKWITNNEYNEYGTNILLRKCTHKHL